MDNVPPPPELGIKHFTDTFSSVLQSLKSSMGELTASDVTLLSKSQKEEQACMLAKAQDKLSRIVSIEGWLKKHRLLF